MRITVLGATGRIGTAFTSQALAAGHRVHVVVRDPSRVPPPASADLTVHAVDVFNPDELLAAMTGADAVVSALGPRSTGPTSVLEDGARSALAAMAKAGVARYVVVSAVGAFADPDDGIATRYILKPLLGAMLRHPFADVRRMESAVRASPIDWTIIRPPRLLDKPLTGRYRTIADRAVPGGRSIARADVAHAILAALPDQSTIGHVLWVAS